MKESFQSKYIQEMLDLSKASNLLGLQSWHVTISLWLSKNHQEASFP